MILNSLGTVGALLVIVAAVLLLRYFPQERTAPGKLYPVGQRKSIAAVFGAGAWVIDSNATGSMVEPAGKSKVALGKAGDIPLAGTWDLSEGPSIGVFSGGVFTLLIKGRPQNFAFGARGDVPVLGDWNGDGRTKIGIVRNGYWLLDSNGNGRWDGPSVDKMIVLGGVPGEKPIVGDWNGDGKTDIGMYRPDTTFALDINGDGVWDKNDKLFTLGGGPGSQPLVGDWNGDGRSKVGVFHNGFWLLDYNGNQKWDGVGQDRFFALGGVAGDVPVIGDWNGDGRTKIGVYRQSHWFIDNDGNGIFDAKDKTWSFGLAGDVPVVITPSPARK